MTLRCKISTLSVLATFPAMSLLTAMSLSQNVGKNEKVANKGIESGNVVKMGMPVIRTELTALSVLAAK